jgi:hypothetical protein
MSGLERSHFSKPAYAPFLAREAGGKKRVDQISCGERTDHSPAHAQDVHVVMLDTLVGRVVVLYGARTHTGSLIRTDGDPDAASVHRDAAVHQPSRHSPASGMTKSG